MPAKRNPLRSIPAVDSLLGALPPSAVPRPMVVAAIRELLREIRLGAVVPTAERIATLARQRVEALERCRLQPVINATGVVIHTNLGRSPLDGRALETATGVGAGYCNLELDLESGARGRRGDYLERCLATLCGAEAVAVVNNCAAALVLILRHFTATKKEVVISRGELVQIGGGFRVPDILETSGAHLREVGTTNRTSLDDYARALGRETGMILKVHRSNFFMEGFVASPDSSELAALARRKRIPLAEDLGSGAVLDTSQFSGIEHEPTPAEVLRRGVDVVCFSGDKLLGGPQAGIIAGKARHVRALKQDPFFRALRCDKLVLSALQAVAEEFLAAPDRASEGIPIHKLLRVSTDELRRRAGALVRELGKSSAELGVITTRAQVGGGTLPRSAPESIALEVRPTNMAAAELATRLRQRRPPVIATVAHGAVKLDLRAVFPEQDGAILRALKEALSGA
ncbi:MAG TPA: L-seryl-tRNA(Sec) selenium transferase [Verrucomicrobiales bacterium]|nr:L-seryl-tRNA(Sec) selenium transferase [Verrucomicrobiales bacterium]